MGFDDTGGRPPEDIVQFTAFDLLHIALFAERRMCVKGAMTVHSRKYDKNKGEYELHYIGAMGEYAIGKHCEVPLDTRIHIGGDNGTDLIINGWTCQVKTRDFVGRNVEVFINGMEEFKAQVLIGVQVLSPTRVKVLGCISRRRFQETACTKDYGYGERLQVPSQRLKPIAALLEVRGR